MPRATALSRRQFITGCSAAVAAMAGSRLVGLSFADGAPSTAPAGAEAGQSGDLIVYVFLRGGMDGLNLLAPVDDADYVAARGVDVRLGDKGDNAALPLKNAPAGGEGRDFRLHPKAAALKELYDGGHLALVHACGLTSGTRSHFEAMDLIERGVADMKDQGLSTGWLARQMIAAAQNGARDLVPAIGTSDSPPVSLLGFGQAAAVNDINDFSFYGDERQRAVLGKLYRASGSDGPLFSVRSAGAKALHTIATINGKLARDGKGELLPYQPEKSATYPENNDLSGSLQTVARLAKMDLGLRVAAVDFGGWDTHQNQQNYFPTLVEQLSTALAAFYNDMSRYRDRLTVVAMSEFGRRLKSNRSDGTDHGHGNVLLALGANVNGGRIFGAWPGLATDQLDSRADLAVTTDYRTVLCELLARRAGNADPAAMFPRFKGYQPLGVFKEA
jgi:uncharacterized protein (DUF1501 family)